MTVRELADELSTLDPDEEVPTDLLLRPLNLELSYVEAALSQWFEIAEMFGRTDDPEVKRFYNEVCRQL